MPAPRYRAPMRSRLDSVPADAGVRRGLSESLCGIGGRLDEAPDDLAAALAQTQAAYGERAARRLARFAELPLGTEVWTRTPDDAYFVGRLASEWRYDASAEAFDADLVHVRDCSWQESAEVPADVAATFARGGRNFQGIHTSVVTAPQ